MERSLFWTWSTSTERVSGFTSIGHLEQPTDTVPIRSIEKMIEAREKCTCEYAFLRYVCVCVCVLQVFLILRHVRFTK
jgi:hypothetical protein